MILLSRLYTTLALAVISSVDVVKVYSLNNGTSLLRGYIVTHTNVAGPANISLDIRDIHRSLTNGDFDRAQDIYLNGKHSYGRNLARYSLDAYQEMNYDPTFLFHVYGLANGNVEEVSAHYAYAHRFVQELFSDKAGILASEAIVALNLWMWVAHKVWDAFKDCQDGKMKADLHAIDEAIAYWIGADQAHKLNSGFALYELSTSAEHDFGQRDANTTDLSKVNEKITDLYATAKMYLSYQSTDEETGSCLSPDALKDLYTVTQEMIATMRIPLMQKLIHAIQMNHPKRIKLYALAIVPQIAACKPSVHLYLQNKLYEVGNYYPERDRTLVLQLLQQSFDCLGFTCEDIGPYQTSIIPQCADPTGLLPLVMYTPDSHVRKFAKIDLDVLQIKILTELRAMDQAYDLYSLGKNALQRGAAEKKFSIQHMATSSNRGKVPRYYQYTSFYNDTNYADVMITMALKGTARYEKLFDSKMRAISVVDTIVQQAIYMYAMESLWWSLEACHNKDNRVGRYDEGIALLIGSIEGPSIGFADLGDGQLLYNLANRNCAQFGVCEQRFGVSQLALALMREMNAGKEALKKFQCNKAETHVINIADMVLLPVFQNVVKYALIGESYPPNELDPILAKGEVATLSLLPIVDFFNESDAITLALNMVVERDIEPVKDGAYAVADALKTTFHKMDYNCSYMGDTESVEICKFSAVHDTFIKEGDEVTLSAKAASSVAYSTGVTWVIAVCTMIVSGTMLMN